MMRSGPRSAVIAPALTKTARRVPARRSWRLSPERFTLLLMLVCLLLQRFAFPIAGLPVSIATPIGYLLVLWGFTSGSLGLDRRRTSLMLGLCAIGCMAYGFQLNMPLAIAPRISLVSLIYWLAVTSFAVLNFREKLSETVFFRVINNCLMVVAIAGILEFLGQYVGINLFSFSDFFPENLLVEYLFNVATPMANGTFRSNGF